jgi:hypothetical protein
VETRRKGRQRQGIEVGGYVAVDYSPNGRDGAKRLAETWQNPLKENLFENLEY